MIIYEGDSTESRYEIILKLLKIKELVTRGEVEERKVAEAKLNLLMKKYGVSILELENNAETVKQMRWFKYHARSFKGIELLGQVIFTVTGNMDIYGSKSYKYSLGVSCSKVQAIEIEAMYDFYYNKIINDLEIFYSAYLRKNNIFPVDKSNTGNSTKARKNSTDLKAVLNMMNGMERHNFNKQLE